MVRKVVKVIDDPETIRVVADPMRREILRQLRDQPKTETQLSSILGLSGPSVGYHLRTLMKAGLIRLFRTKISSHGIQEKYYVTVSKLFLESFESVPVSLKRYFIHIHIERIRGILSTLQLIEGSRGGEVAISLKELEEVAHEIANRIAIVGKRYEMMRTKEIVEAEVNAEVLLMKLYSEALKEIVAEHRWKALDLLDELVSSVKRIH